MTEQEAAVWLENMQRTLEINRGRLNTFVAEIEKICPGYWETIGKITAEALKVAVGRLRGETSDILGN